MSRLNRPPKASPVALDSAQPRKATARLQIASFIYAKRDLLSRSTFLYISKASTLSRGDAASSDHLYVR